MFYASTIASWVLRLMTAACFSVTPRANHFGRSPGGRAELGEPAAQTLKREMLEELNTKVEVVRLLWLVENLFEYADKEYHEIGLYFLMRFPDDSEILRQSQPLNWEFTHGCHYFRLRGSFVRK
jgi:8-oxo-dGTP pyrophosphatase MutT (NUDIX family)